MSPSPLWTVSIDVEPAAVAAFEAALAPFCQAVSAFAAGDGTWRLQGLCRELPDAVAFDVACRLAAAAAGTTPPSLRVAPLHDRDWVAAVHAALPEVNAGRFTVYGSHLDPEVARGRIGLAIDAAQAFGSGHHPSTAGCLVALSRLAHRPVRRALDLGCGSGVLAIAIAKLWRAHVVAADIDPNAVAAAVANARGNGVGPLLRCVASDGLAAEVKALGPYDLTVANILARPLRRLAADIAGCLAKPGYAVLAGFLGHDENAVRAAYRAHRMTPLIRVAMAGWITLVLRR